MHVYYFILLNLWTSYILFNFILIVCDYAIFIIPTYKYVNTYNMKNIIIKMNFIMIYITIKTALQGQYSPIKFAKSSSLTIQCRLIWRNENELHIITFLVVSLQYMSRYWKTLPTSSMLCKMVERPIFFLLSRAWETQLMTTQSDNINANALRCHDSLRYPKR